jgi:hypothetical protein
MGKRCFAIQARGAGAKNSPARKGWVHKAIERRRCGTILSAFVHWESCDFFRSLRVFCISNHLYAAPPAWFPSLFPLSVARIQVPPTKSSS